MQPAELPYERLRRLAVEDPREARKVFLRILDSGGSALEQFLGQHLFSCGRPLAARGRQRATQQS